MYTKANDVRDISAGFYFCKIRSTKITNEKYEAKRLYASVILKVKIIDLLTVNKQIKKFAIISPQSVQK